MKPAVIATLALCATAGSAVAASLVASEQFPAVTLVSTQDSRVTLTNVRSSGPTTACDLQVRFLLVNGALSGTASSVSLAPKASATVSHTGVTGLLRAAVNTVDPSDKGRLCAVRSALEVYEKSSGATLYIVQGQSCLGAADCGAP